jgi:poly-beta-1,6-N-acetyl-D-glucosamine synthase
MDKESYVLITPARNEEAYIEKTIESVISQTILPKKWVIVSDGSTDRTDEIVSDYVARYDFIQLLRVAGDGNRNFGSKVNAFNAGYKQLEGIDYDFIGIVDADVSFDSDYYENVLARFEQNPKLGIAGGIFFDVYDGKSHGKPHKALVSLNSVRGPIQLFRRRCYRDIGGYIPQKLGGEDTVAEVMARMYGWEVQSFPKLKGLHHRLTGTEGLTIWRARFRQGIVAYSLGYHPLFQIAKCLYRVAEKPSFIGSILTMCGYYWSALRQDERIVSTDFVKYIRQEQMHRLKSLFLRFNRI